MISPRINKNCSKYQAIELIFQKTGDCMKRFFILLPFAFFSFFIFAQTKLELYKDMVTTDNLRLRTPYAENKIITVLNKGTKVKIIDIEDEKETIDGITSNWVTVEVQKNAKDKDNMYNRTGIPKRRHVEKTFPCRNECGKAEFLPWKPR